MKRTPWPENRGTCICPKGHEWSAIVEPTFDEVGENGVRIKPMHCPTCGELFVSATTGSP